MSSRRLRVAGVMSGTSADGFDVAVADIGPGWRWRLVAFRHFPYNRGERAEILRVAAGQGSAAEVAALDFALGRRIGRALAAMGNPRLDLVASHGQTIFHAGRRATLQVGNPAVIAAAAGAPVVSDFRSADVAQGGEGAPLVPWADWRLFGHPRRFRAALNLGGIANLTLIPPAAGAGDIVGFDTGPGNMALDAAMQTLAPPRPYDRGGRLALAGAPDAALLRRLLRHPFFRRPPPKSCGREQFGASFVAAARAATPSCSDADFLATLAELTARTVAAHLPPGAEVVMAGGGVRNRALIRALAAAAPACRFRLSDELGVPAQAREALAFALLGAAHLRGEPASLPRVTGARRPAVLGSYTPGGR